MIQSSTQTNLTHRRAERPRPSRSRPSSTAPTTSKRYQTETKPCWRSPLRRDQGVSGRCTKFRSPLVLSSACAGGGRRAGRTRRSSRSSSAGPRLPTSHLTQPPSSVGCFAFQRSVHQEIGGDEWPSPGGPEWARMPETHRFRKETVITTYTVIHPSLLVDNYPLERFGPHENDVRLLP